MTTKKKKTTSPAKEKLIYFSKIAKTIQSEIKKKGKYEIPKINDIVIKLYQKKEKAQTFKKFKAWLDEGYKVIKGSKGFAVWSRPLKNKKEKEAPNGVSELKFKNTEKDMKKTFSFYGIAYLFNENQVEKIIKT